VQELADAVIATSPHVVAVGKAAFYDELPLDEATAYARATSIIAANAAHADGQEGISAFLQKRPPQWRNV
jgi:enoyl-CoA hydratase/carnithine racemase